MELAGLEPATSWVRSASELRAAHVSGADLKEEALERSLAQGRQVVDARRLGADDLSL
jgi:hypothetical protein